ncbi:MAG: L-2,4-diaminobutyrate decarboxylase [Gaiellales bacterium]|jgi:glutamate/tyrosine decarboxylase-like PLP-dependent enzyme|nr:L-2,4-diaminobutyrate decarboxylase [Gaiellales bacterium]
MHRYSDETERLAQAVMRVALDRLRMDAPLDGPRSKDELEAKAGQTISAGGMGGEEALRIWTDILAPATMSVDHPRYLAFIPGAPTEVSTLFDLVVGASSLYGGSWLESSGAVYAENQALGWVAGLAGLPEGAGGCFAQGGTVGNLSALVAARHTMLERRGGERPRRWQVAITAETHSSVVYDLERVMDVDAVNVPADERGRMTGKSLEQALVGADTDGLFAVVATAGTTNTGVVDDLAGIAEVCRRRGIWMHVDGAYGAAALAAPSARHLFAGIEHADSFIVDPHKWLFGPFDCCALLYRDPEFARRAHTQHAGYLDVVTSDEVWNPSDYAVHLSRRARGLPFWFSLAVHGTDAYRDALETTLRVARESAEEIRRRPYVELLLEPDLSVLIFRRLGWDAADYHSWSRRLLAEGYAFVTPTTHNGETCTRIAIVNPRTTVSDIVGILATMA